MVITMSEEPMWRKSKSSVSAVDKPRPVTPSYLNPGYYCGDTVVTEGHTTVRMYRHKNKISLTVLRVSDGKSAYIGTLDHYAMKSKAHTNFLKELIAICAALGKELDNVEEKKA